MGLIPIRISSMASGDLWTTCWLAPASSRNWELPRSGRSTAMKRWCWITTPNSNLPHRSTASTTPIPSAAPTTTRCSPASSSRLPTVEPPATASAAPPWWVKPSLLPARPPTPMAMASPPTAGRPLPTAATGLWLARTAAATASRQPMKANSCDWWSPTPMQGALPKPSTWRQA